MPNPITLSTITVATATKGGGVKNNGTAIPPVVHLDPKQICGLVPMRDCDSIECRQPLDISCCFKNPVFGNVISGVPVSTSTYENDWNYFWTDMAIYSSNTTSATATWSLEKADSNCTFSKIANLNNNENGIYVALGSISNHKTYTAYYINWGNVLHTYGFGIYRIKVNTAMRSLAGCLVSDWFDLKAWNCNLARGTVKFETQNAGTIGNANDDGSTFNLCGLIFLDSIRIKGFFGNKQTPQYIEVFDKFQNGELEDIRDEAIRKWTFYSHPISQEYSDRLSIYMMLSINTKVSDYNLNNSDYNIKQLGIRKATAFEPTYYDTKIGGIRMAKVKIEFNARIQNLISSLCCDAK